MAKVFRYRETHSRNGTLTASVLAIKAASEIFV